MLQRSSQPSPQPLPQQSLIPVKPLALTPEQLSQLAYSATASPEQSVIEINGQPYLIRSDVRPTVHSPVPASPQVVIQHYENSFNQESFNASTSAFVSCQNARFHQLCQLIAAGLVCIAILTLSAVLIYHAPDRSPDHNLDRTNTLPTDPYR